MAGEKELLNWKKVLQGLGSYAVRDENGAETFRLLRETETETDFFFGGSGKRNGTAFSGGTGTEVEFPFPTNAEFPFYGRSAWPI
jgi:hypothetical protein